LCHPYAGSALLHLFQRNPVEQVVSRFTVDDNSATGKKQTIADVEKSLKKEAKQPVKAK
jgi:hypothetical protein